MVAAGLADELEIQVAYAIGVANPVSIFVDSHGTGKLDDEALAGIVKKEFDLRPYAIIKELELRNPIFKKTAAYGHFGYKGFPWEKLDRVEALAKYL
jgi:S-adenosylmethionine synthetase